MWKVVCINWFIIMNKEIVWFCVIIWLIYCCCELCNVMSYIKVRVGVFIVSLIYNKEWLG